MFESVLGFGLSKSHSVNSNLDLHGIQGLVLTLPLCVTFAKRFRVSVWLYSCHPCRVVGRGFLTRKCIYVTRPVSAHPLGAISVSC